MMFGKLVQDGSVLRSLKKLCTWPDDKESIDAAVIAIAAATEAKDPKRLLSIVSQIPADSPRRGELLLRAGSALWREVLEKQRIEGESRPKQEEIDAWKQKAVESIDTGLQGATTPGDKIAVMGAAARCQIAMADADPNKVEECLHNAVWGPWTVVQKKTKHFLKVRLQKNRCVYHFVISSKKMRLKTQPLQ